MQKKPKYLLRLFTEYEYADRFVKYGHLYMNSLSYFRNLENSFQGDHCEGDMLNGKGGAIFRWGSETDDKSAVSLNLTSIPIDGFVYCFFAIYEEQLKINGDTLNWIGEKCNMLTAMQKHFEDHGRTIIVLLDFEDVMSKIQGVLDSKPFNILPSLIDNVQYHEVDSMDRFRALIEIIVYRKEEPVEYKRGIIENNLRLLAFIKPESYAYQQELRVYLYCSPNETLNHLDLYIGDLRPYLLAYAEFQPINNKSDI